MTGASNHHGIVVGVDGSSSSTLAVEWAAREAAMRHLPLTLVHVLMPPVSLTWPDIPAPVGLQNWQETQGQVFLDEAVKIARDATRGTDFQIRRELVNGGPMVSLADLSKDAEIVVAGCHGRGRLRQVLGSVSSGLAHHAHCPVAIVHDENPLLLDVASAPVVVGIDGSPASEAATATAFDEASRRGVDLVAVHACSDWRDADNPAIDWSALEERGREVLAERLAGWQERYPDVTVRRVVVANQAAQHLVEESKHAQLVVVGSHGRGGFAGMLLGSVSSAVVQSARSPVIVARAS